MKKAEISERKNQMINNLKQMLSDFVENGGNVDDLTINNPEYQAVKNHDIYFNGRRLTLEERFSFLGFPRTAKQKPFDEKLKELRAMLDEFVANGGDINSIDVHHPIYIEMRSFTPKINGRKISVEEAFALAGHPRKPRYNDKQLFIGRLTDLETYQDENGYVDSYRKDQSMKQFVSYCSESFEIPTSLVVCLLANQKLKNHVVITNRIEFLRTKLAEYLESHRDFCGIRRLDPQLYNLLTSIAKTYQTPDGHKLSNLEIVELLGFENINNSFSKINECRQFSEEAFMKRYLSTINANNGTISLTDMHPSDYNALSFYLRRRNETKRQFFERYNVRYLDQRIVERNKRVTLPEYPYLDEMKELLAEMLTEYHNQNPEIENASEEEIFQIKLEAIKAIYSQYKEKIEQKYILDSEESSSQDNQKQPKQKTLS